MAVETELRRLYERDGSLTPVQVVREAESPDSPLHSHFEWDDSAAGPRWRIEQARQLIRSCRIVVETTPDRVVQVRSFLNVPDVGYAPVEVALGESRDVVLGQLIRELQVLRLKYQTLCDFDAALRAALTVAAA